jgi:hypothetical protein
MSFLNIVYELRYSSKATYVTSQPPNGLHWPDIVRRNLWKVQTDNKVQSKIGMWSPPGVTVAVESMLSAFPSHHAFPLEVVNRPDWKYWAVAPRDCLGELDFSAVQIDDVSPFGIAYRGVRVRSHGDAFPTGYVVHKPACLTYCTDEGRRALIRAGIPAGFFANLSEIQFNVIFRHLEDRPYSDVVMDAAREFLAKRGESLEKYLARR